MADNKLLGASGLYFGVNEISKAFMGNNLVWEKAGEAGPDYSKEYFCIEAIENCDIIFEPYQGKAENGHSFAYIIFRYAAYDRPPMDFLYQAFVDGNYDVFDPYYDHQLIISLYAGDIIYMIGNMDKGVSAYNDSISNIFTFSGKVNLSGNIMSLTHGLHRNTLEPTRPQDLPEKTYTSNDSGGELARLFKNQPVVDAGNLVLSSYKINIYTCWQMFYGCTYLTTAPELSATLLTSYCYREMFKGCSSLTTAPKLPATTLAANCYRAMFAGCTSLTTAPELPATTAKPYCYYYMFENCTSLTNVQATLPATALAIYCYQRMFTGCTSLTTAPELPAKTLLNYCYNNMFNGCTSLRYVKCLATNISASNCTSYWLKSVASSGTFVKPASMTSWTTGTSGIPSGWTVQTASS